MLCDVSVLVARKRKKKNHGLTEKDRVTRSAVTAEPPTYIAICFPKCAALRFCGGACCGVCCSACFGFTSTGGGAGRGGRSPSGRTGRAASGAALAAARRLRGGREAPRAAATAGARAARGAGGLVPAAAPGAPNGARRGARGPGAGARCRRHAPRVAVPVLRAPAPAANRARA